MDTDSRLIAALQLLVALVTLLTITLMYYRVRDIERRISVTPQPYILVAPATQPENR